MSKRPSHWYRNEELNSNKRIYEGDEIPKGYTREAYSAWQSIIQSGSKHPNYGKHHSEETKKKLSYMRNDSKQQVAMCDIKTEEVIEIFDSYSEAGRYLRENTKYVKADDSAISKCARGKINHAYGYKWKKLEGVTTNCRGEIDTLRSA